jgi:hypothetical protein
MPSACKLVPPLDCGQTLAPLRVAASQPSQKVATLSLSPGPVQHCSHCLPLLAKQRKQAGHNKWAEFFKDQEQSQDGKHDDQEDSSQHEGKAKVFKQVCFLEAHYWDTLTDPALHQDGRPEDMNFDEGKGNKEPKSKGNKEHKDEMVRALASDYDTY